MSQEVRDKLLHIQFQRPTEECEVQGLRVDSDGRQSDLLTLLVVLHALPRTNPADFRQVHVYVPVPPPMCDLCALADL